MNDSAIAWVEKLPRRWARNAAILAVIVALISVALTTDFSHSPRLSWITLGIAAALLTLLCCVVTFLIGMAARRDLRNLQNLTDEAAYKTVASLPHRYFAWGLLLGYFLPASDFLLQWRGNLFQPWDSEMHIAYNVGQFIGPMLIVAVITAIIGFISRAALRKRLRGLRPSS